MPRDPSSQFAQLLRACINDEDDPRRSFAKDGVLVFILGIGSSVITTYLLAALGILV